MLGISGGCEPEFALSYKRRTDNLKELYDVYCKSVSEYWEMTDDVVDKGNIDSLPKYFVTSADVYWKDRVDTQAIMQKYVDTAISSTINLHQNIDIKEVEQIYLYAWEQGLKGITVFRDGCKRLGILTTNDDKDTSEEELQENLAKIPTGFRRGDIIDVSDDLIGYKRKIVNGCGDFSEQIFFDDFTGEPLENYIAMGDGGGCSRNLEAISRLISLCLRGGIDVGEVIKQLKKVHSCPAYRARKIQKGDTSIGTSCPSAIGYAIEELCNKINDRLFDGTDMDDSLICDDSDHNMMIKSWYEDSKSEVEDLTLNQSICPECGAKLQHEGGCVVCRGDETHAGCGWSKCD